MPLLAEAGKFLGGHAFLPRDYDKIPREDIAAMSELLLGGDAGIFTKEAIIMILAHHPSRDALDCLVRYNRCPDERLKIFAEFALDECRWWNSK